MHIARKVGKLKGNAVKKLFSIIYYRPRNVFKDRRRKAIVSLGASRFARQSGKTCDCSSNGLEFVVATMHLGRRRWSGTSLQKRFAKAKSEA
jgi:hypothetical protein